MNILKNWKQIMANYKNKLQHKKEERDLTQGNKNKDLISGRLVKHQCKFISSFSAAQMETIGMFYAIEKH